MDVQLSKDQGTACVEALHVTGNFMCSHDAESCRGSWLVRDHLQGRQYCRGFGSRDYFAGWRRVPAGRLDRMLCFLASHGILKCCLRGGDPPRESGSSERIYALTPTSELFVDSEKGMSLAPLLTICFNPASTALWQFGKAAILDGVNSFEKSNGVPVFQYGSDVPSYNDEFNMAMMAKSTVEMEGILKVYGGFEGLKSLVDVGRGTGMCLSMVVSKYPSIKGVNFYQLMLSDTLLPIQASTMLEGICLRAFRKEKQS
ncbi:hypothetical protein SAY87_031442 [Trapa incisa]|uniref:O-methyltransferase C-terminal domain-containing protein n=1 Tax=Trapa incisa TaxID=236973 RepID=A0AAN7KQ72_9MYRT|nr:hypothetical protein SAY87_031442 [Trapa incisa]